MKNLKLSQLFDNKTFCKIFSIVGAIIIWASVTLNVKNDSEKLLRNVPIDFSVAGTAVEALGLSTFDHSDDSINIRLSGRRGALNSVSKDDFLVTLSVGKVTKSGKHTVRVDVALKENIDNAVSIIDYSPKNIQVNFDRLASKTVPISIDLSGVSAKDGYMLDKGYPSFPEITINGPETIIDTVSSCVAKVDSKKKELDETFIASAVPFTFFDSNNKEITDANITSDKDSVDVSIPVLKVKELPIFVQFLNAPSTFNAKDLKYTLSTSKIEIAGPEETVDEMSQIDVRYVDLKTTKPGSTTTLNIELPSGLVNVSNINTVDVTISDKNLTERAFSVSQFNLIGVPDGKSARVVTKQLNNVLIMGEESLLNSITASDIMVEVNLANTTIAKGTMTVPATITIPNKTGVLWPFGEYAVVIRSN